MSALVKLACLAILMAVTTATPNPQPVYPDDAIAAGVLPEVRIRKLHLVRPDLIYYPISQETIC